MKNRVQQQPLSLRPKKEVLEKMRKIAEVNGLSMSDVANMCLAGGLNIVESKLSEIHGTKKAA
jgi:hypothetical protein